MATFILLTKLSPISMGDAQTRRNLGRAWFESVKKNCPQVHWKDHYALLGANDFMDIYEAPDEEQAARVAMICMQQGAVSAETVPAIPYQRFLDLIADM